MTIEECNALRSVSRQIWKEIQEGWKQQGIDDTSNKRYVGQREEVNRKVLRAWEKKLNPRFTIPQIIIGIGMVRGVIVMR